MKRLVLIAMMCALVGTGLFAAGQSEAAAPRTVVMRYGEVNPAGHPITDGAMEFARLVEQYSEGRIRIDVFPAGQLGSEREQMQSLQQGGLDFFRGNTASMADFGVREMALLGLPYVFASRDHMWRALNGEAGTYMLGRVQAAGTRMVALAYLDDGARHIFTTQRPVRRISDLRGLRIRVPQNEVFMEMVAAMGASPTPIAFGELYSALQTGIVDGAENTIAGYLTNSFYEPAPYLTLNRHMSPPGLILVSEVVWNRLSEGDRTIISRAAREASELVTAATAAFEEDGLAELRNRGATILEVDNVAEWQRAVSPLWDKYGADFRDLLAQIAAAQ